MVDAQPLELADYLENRAAQTGQSAHLFLSQSIREVYALMREQDEYGGTRIAFIRWLDGLVRERLPVIQQSDPHWAAKLARDFRDEIRKRTASYDPQETYE